MYYGFMLMALEILVFYCVLVCDVRLVFDHVEISNACEQQFNLNYKFIIITTGYLLYLKAQTILDTVQNAESILACRNNLLKNPSGYAEMETEIGAIVKSRHADDAGQFDLELDRAVHVEVPIEPVFVVANRMDHADHETA